MFEQGGHRLGGAGDYNVAPGSQVGDPSELISQHRTPLGCGLCCLIVCGIIALMSIGTVEPLTVGIRYNSFNKAADTNQVYEPGRHLIGPFNKFLIFPSSIQTIEFTNMRGIQPQGVRLPALRAQDVTGLPVQLHVSVQYRLIKQDIGHLYKEYNLAYEIQIINAMKKQIAQAATKYSVGQFWQKRDEFRSMIQQMVDGGIREFQAECWGLQLWNYDIPKNVDTSLINRQLQQQLKAINQAAQTANVTRSQTEIYAAEYARQEKVTLAKANAEYTLITKSAKANARQQTIEAEAAVMVQLKQELGLEAPELVTYQRYTAMDDLGGANLVYGFGGPQQVLLR